MMWTIALIFLFCIQTEVMTENPIHCEYTEGLPAESATSPSYLADSKVTAVTDGKKVMLNISWAVNIDASIHHLTGTMIHIEGKLPILCRYTPLLRENTTGPKQWFYTLQPAKPGFYLIQANNVPLHPQWPPWAVKSANITVDEPVEPTVKLVIFQDPTAVALETPTPYVMTTSALVGVMAFLIIISCYLTYKCCGDNFAMCLGFKRVAPADVVPVPVLVVYPAENPSFQQAVVALAEFLQWHGGCSVAIDMWQQQKIGELGLMRWLAEQASAAHRVLIVCPKESSKQSCSPSCSSFPEPHIPAAAYDLYPMILNMVASHAKGKSDLAKFWVVQFDKKHRKRPNTLPLELRACRSFCLMKDLKKLCINLHNNRQANKLPCLNFGSEITLSKHSVEKFNDAVEKHLQRITLTNVTIL
ncbi:uncharacterized protein il17rb isoform X2 [Cynoglossus semilaevis]|uniref:uncharacterized protein il17rb isoform X2 n=1 Tax=Cynoglossus semilaevis TaxID=244447 RepID=UPI0007DCA0D8|nr:interleukin-17 receptor B isoform X2 [Cynoglossus semilaevis]